MSASELDTEYQLHQLDTLPLTELRTLYRKVVTELQDVKLEFEDFQCKY